MPALDRLPRLARFNNFELDLQSGELRQNGREPIRLRDQSFQILLALLERRGEVVLREELRNRLWPNDTVVEFEHSISAAMNKLRHALGDSADNPHFIETFARRGYRWMIPVEWVKVGHEKTGGASVGGTHAPRNLIGKKVSHYRILDVLGGGGMGVVYKAEDMKLGRSVAVKFLGEELVGDPRALERFEREAQSISALDHANICTIHEVEEHEGQPFLVMQLLQGQTLRQRIESAGFGQSVFSQVELLDFGIQIASGLEAAHQRGILHRDVKPANIFITVRSEIKLLDFGLAKLMDMNGASNEAERQPARAGAKEANVAIASESSMSLTGAMMGTASYMSPEQVRKEKLDARSDLFSFGVVLFEMATGRQPFRGDDLQAIHDAVLHSEPPSPLVWNPDLPEGFEAIIGKALAKGREQRYQSAGEIISELKRVQLATLERFTKSRVWLFPLLVLLALSGALLVLNVTGFREWLRNRLPSKSAVSSAVQIRSLAVLPLENLSPDPEQEYFAEGLTDELTSRLAVLPGIRVISRTSASQYKSTHKTAPQIGRELGVDAFLEGTLERVGERVRLRLQLVRARTDQHIWAESYDYHLGDVLALETDFARDVAGQIRVQLTNQETRPAIANEAVNPVAFEDYLKGRYFWNRRDGGALDKAIEYFQRAIAADPTYAPAYADLAQSYILLSDPARAKSAAEKALSLNPRLAEAHTALGLINEEFWNFAEAEKEYKLAIGLNPNYATAHHWYGEGYLMLMGRFEEAEREMKKARTLDPVSRIIATDWGVLLYFERHYDEAYQELSKVLEMEPGFSEALMFRGAVLMRQRRYMEGVADLENSSRIDGGPEKLGVLGWGLASAGKRSEATAILRRLNAMSRQKQVPAWSLAVTYVGLGDTDKAFAWLDKAYAEHSFELRALKVDPIYDPLRSDPRFPDLQRRVGVVQ